MKSNQFLASLAALLVGAAHGNHLVMEIFQESVERMQSLRRKKLPDTFREGRVNCEDGVVSVNGEVYDCNNVDFLSFISAADLKIPGAQGNLQSSDVWGWVDEARGREITILTLDTGVVFIDSTDPENPCILSKHHSARPPSSWGDVKVIGDYAYAIKDFPGRDPMPGVGMEVYDLKNISRLDCPADPEDIPLRTADFVTSNVGFCHNVISNTETGRVYACGCEACEGGLVIYDVKKDPLRPDFLGCVDGDGYTHDAQCVVYTGPDDKYAGKEICIAFNEEHLTIWDVTDAGNPIQISRTGYNNQVYTHQGWFNYDMSKILLDDELDERCNMPDLDDANKRRCESLALQDLNGELRTTTYIWNVNSLDAPVLESSFIHRDQSIDHNLYVWGAIHERGWGGNAPMSPLIPDPNVAYLNNYMAGLIMIDISDEDSNNWQEVGSFDITETTESEFQGAWSGYLHPSGVYAISSIEKGVFFLDPKVQFVTAASALATPFPTNSPPEPEQTTDDDSSTSPVLYVFFILFVIGTVGVGVLLVKSTGKKGNDEDELAISSPDSGEDEVAEKEV